MRRLGGVFGIFVFVALFFMAQNGYCTEPGHTTWSKVVTSGSTALAIRADGTLWGWGSNGSGQIGDGTKTNRSFPVQVGDPNARWVDVTTNYGASFAIREDGSLFAWGYNSYGRLGDGTKVDRLSPVRISNPDNGEWISISTGLDSSAGVFHFTCDNDDLECKAKTLHGNPVLYTWGENDFAQFGTFVDAFNVRVYRSYVPVSFVRGDFESVQVNGWTVVAKKTDGSLAGWGNNVKGQLGIGVAANVTSPTEILSSDGQLLDYCLSNNALVVVKTDGKIYGAGYNNYGVIGETRSTSPQPNLLPISAINNEGFVKVSLNNDQFTMGLKADGTTWGMGYNYWGQLGNGNRIYYVPLTQMGSASDWGFISSGGPNVMRINQYGELFSNGQNVNGVLGRAGDIFTPGIVDIP